MSKKKKNFKCPRCGIIVELLMNTDHDIICPKCNKLRILKKNETLDMIKSNAIKLSKAFDEKLLSLEFPGNLFHLILAEQGQVAERIQWVYRDPAAELIERWVLYQFVLERMQYFDLDITKTSSLEEKDFSFLIPFVEEALKTHRIQNDIKKGECIFAIDHKNPLIANRYITAKKVLIGTTINIHKILEKKHPIRYPHLSLKLVGNNPSAFINNEYRKLDYNAALKVLTNLRYYTTHDLISDKTFTHKEALLIIGENLLKWIQSGEVGIENIGSGIRKIHLDVLENLKDFLIKLLEFHSYKDGEEVDGIFEHLFNEVIKYFSSKNKFQIAFFLFEDFIFTSIKNLKFLWFVFSHSIELSKKEQGALKNYRGTRFEYETWRLGFHLEIKSLFPDMTPMINIYSNQKECADVVFFKDGHLEIIQCKNYVALSMERQIKIYSKFHSDKDKAINECQNRGMEIKSSSLTLFSRICIKPPSKKIKVFIQDMQLLDYLIGKYRLFEWQGKSLFEQFPILAKIAWENFETINIDQIDLEHFIGQENLILSIGDYVNGEIKFEYQKNMYSLPIEVKSYNEFSWEKLKIVLIWNKKNDLIKDYIFLPRYWKEDISEQDLIYQTHFFHKTPEGQKFLYVACLNGVFGYCLECKYPSLVPIGYLYKPSVLLAKGKCPSCGKEYSLLYYIGLFGENKNLFERIKKAINLRFF